MSSTVSFHIHVSLVSTVRIKIQIVSRTPVAVLHSTVTLFCHHTGVLPLLELRVNGISGLVLLCLASSLHVCLQHVAFVGFLRCCEHSVVWIVLSLSILLLRDIWIISSFLAVMDDTVMNASVHNFLFSLGTPSSSYILRSEIAGL